MTENTNADFPTRPKMVVITLAILAGGEFFILYANTLPVYTSDIFIGFLNVPWSTDCINRLRPLKYFSCAVGSSDFVLRKRSNTLPLNNDVSTSNGTPIGNASCSLIPGVDMVLPAMRYTGLCFHVDGSDLGCCVGLWESSEVRFNPTGQVSVFTGAHSHAQGHDTTFAQIAADELGVPLETVDVVHGDTDKGTFGMGTYGSRSLAVGGIAIVNACKKIVAKGKRVAAKTFRIFIFY